MPLGLSRLQPQNSRVRQTGWRRERDYNRQSLLEREVPDALNAFSAQLGFWPGDRRFESLPLRHGVYFTSEISWL